MRTNSRMTVFQSAVAILTSACLFGLATPAQSASAQGWWPWAKASVHSQAAQGSADWPAWFKPGLNTQRVANQALNKSLTKNRDTVTANATNAPVNPRQVEFSMLFAEVGDAVQAIRRAAALERMVSVGGITTGEPQRGDVAVLAGGNGRMTAGNESL